MKKTVIIIVGTLIGLFIISYIFRDKNKGKDEDDNVQTTEVSKADKLRALYDSLKISVVEYGVPLRKVEDYLIVFKTKDDTLAETGQVQFIAWDAQISPDNDTLLISRWRIDMAATDSRYILKNDIISLTSVK